VVTSISQTSTEFVHHAVRPGCPYPFAVVTGRVTTDLRAGVIVVEFIGELTQRAKDVVRSTVFKCLVECPNAVVVDLGGLDDKTDGSSVAMLYALQHAAQADPGVPLLLCRATGALAEHLGRPAWREQLRVYETRELALAAVEAGPLPGRRARAHLTVDPATPRVARGLAFSACVAWGHADVAQRVQRVVSELVNHSLEHAGTDIELWLAVRGAYIYVGVRDGDQNPPEMREPTDIGTARLVDLGAARLVDLGRGLRIVEHEAANWGCVTGDTGKLVWALVKTAQPEAPPVKFHEASRSAGPV
jgi:hypothetical protein